MTPPPTLHDRIITGVILVLAAMLPVWIVLAHRALAPTLLAMGFIVATRQEPWRRGMPYFLLRPDLSSSLVRAALAMGAFAVWAGASALWGPGANGLSFAGGIILPIVAGGAVVWETGRMGPRRARFVALAFAAAAAAAVLLVAVEAATGGGLRAITPPLDLTPGRSGDFVSAGRGATVIALTLVPGLVLVSLFVPVRIAIVALAGPAIYAAFYFDILANAAAIGLGAAVFLAALKKPRVMASVLLGGAIAALALAPLAAFIPVDAAIDALSGRFPVSWLQRLAIWRQAGETALACLPVGCGADYARSVHAAGQTIVFPGVKVALPLMPVHPHSVFLQIWLELGPVGAAFFGAAVWFGARALMASPLGRIEKAAALATAAGVFLSFLVEASLWQVWRISTPLLAAIYIALAHRLRTEAATNPALK